MSRTFSPHLEGLLGPLLSGGSHHKFHAEHFRLGDYVTKSGVVPVWRKMWMKERNQITRMREQAQGTFWPIRNVARIK